MSESVRQNIIKDRKDLSPYLIHLTRSGDWKKRSSFYDLEKDEDVPLDPKTSLIGILQHQKIEARTAFGYFNYLVPFPLRNGLIKNSHSRVKREWLRSVCFTETPLQGLESMMIEVQSKRNLFKPYGLAFHDSVIRRANGM